MTMLRRSWWGLIGLGSMAAGTWVLATDVPRWNTTFYLFAWYGWLLVVDAVVSARTGRSLVVDRPRELAAMMFWSVPFWLLFETYNLELENWVYVFVPRTAWVREAYGWLAFATVLPACFLHAELARSFRVGEGRRWKPLALGRGVAAIGFVTVGLACTVLPLVAPTYAFPLVWGVTFFIPALINVRLGLPSVVGDLERGDPSRLLRLVAGGLLAGLVWEGLNFWARCKWIYTVPFFDELKLFEMPLLGFLGFPVLALSAFEGYSLICGVARGGRHWEADAPRPERSVVSGVVWAAIAALAVVGSHLFFVRLADDSVGAVRPTLAEMAPLDRRMIEALESAGVETPERLARAFRAEGAKQLSKRAEVPPAAMIEAAKRSELAIHKGMGAAAAQSLIWAQVSTIAELAERDPTELADTLRKIGENMGAPVPDPDWVGVWVRAAEGRKRPKR